MLKDKIVVITGGAGLIGKIFAESVVKNGGSAIIADIDIGIAEKVKNELSNSIDPDKVDCFQLDITSKKDLNECVAYLDKKYGRIDALVNNAYPRNKNYGQGFFDVEYNDLCENINLNLGGYFLTSQQFSKYFIKQGYGNIVNIGSIYGVVPPRFEIYENTHVGMPVEYAMIKSGLIHLTKYMTKYLKGKNIRINVLSPGGIFNNQDIDFINRYNKYASNKGMLDATDLQGTLVYLLSDMSQYVNGQNIIVDDGWSL